MASHSGAVTVDVAPADSAVSVVGTGVELGARPVAMSAIVDSMLSCSGILLALGVGVSRPGCWKSRRRTEVRFADPRGRPASSMIREPSRTPAMSPDPCKLSSL